MKEGPQQTHEDEAPKGVGRAADAKGRRNARSDVRVRRLWRNFQQEVGS